LHDHAIVILFFGLKICRRCRTHGTPSKTPSVYIHIDVFICWFTYLFVFLFIYLLIYWCEKIALICVKICRRSRANGKPWNAPSVYIHIDLLIYLLINLLMYSLIYWCKKIALICVKICRRSMTHGHESPFNPPSVYIFWFIDLLIYIFIHLIIYLFICSFIYVKRLYFCVKICRRCASHGTPSNTLSVYMYVFIYLFIYLFVYVKRLQWLAWTSADAAGLIATVP